MIMKWLKVTIAEYTVLTFLAGSEIFGEILVFPKYRNTSFSLRELSGNRNTVVVKTFK
jgi:hypothetical protein